MDKEFVTYEIALALKELGFDESYLAVYGKNTSELYIIRESDKFDSIDEMFFIKAPLKQQVFRWFREKYQDVLLRDYGLIPHFTMIQNMFLDSNKIWTYEEAENACIDKLISITKQQN